MPTDGFGRTCPSPSAGSNPAGPAADRPTVSPVHLAHRAVPRACAPWPPSPRRPPPWPPHRPSHPPPTRTRATPRCSPGGAGRTGRLGNGTTTDSLGPVSVTSLFRGDVDQISAGGTSSSDSFVLARTAKTVKSWGNNATSQLGDGTVTPSATPVKVLPPGSGIAHVATAETGRSSFAY